MAPQHTHLDREAAEAPGADAPAAAESRDALAASRQAVRRLEQREREFAELARITERINYGVQLTDVLEFLYHDLRTVIPYNRIGFSVVDADGRTVTSRWSRSDRRRLLVEGYRAPLAGSTLNDILTTGRPRVLNDLAAYLAGKPHSHATRLIVREGMRSSLTCPLFVQGKPIGFLFFSSVEPDTYARSHVRFFEQIAAHVAATLEKGRLYSELADQKAVIEAHNRQMREELAMARQVQRALVPERPPDIAGLEIAVHYEPAIEVGGDVLDIIPLGAGRTLFFVGDAMGHGVQAAMVMSTVKTALDAAARADPDPPAVLSSINAMLTRLFGEAFVTATCCAVDTARMTAKLALAGHPCPALYRPRRHALQRGYRGGLPLGVEADTRYDRAAFDLEPDDLLVFHTDGIVEAVAPDGTHYGIERLDAAIRRTRDGSPDQVVSSIRADLAGHLGPCQPDDDCTLLVVRTGAAPPASWQI